MIEQPQSQGFFAEFFVFFLAEKGAVGKLIFVVGLFFSQPFVVQANAASAPTEISQPSLTIGIPDTLVNPKDVIELQKMLSELRRSLPKYHVATITFSAADGLDALRKDKPDFILAPTGFFATIDGSPAQNTYKIATRINLKSGDPEQSVGAALAVLNERKDLVSLADLQHKTAQSGLPNTIDSWLSVRNELKKNHYDDESFNDDREALIRSLPEKGIGRIINVGASIETTKTTLELAAKYDYIYAAVGVHPSDISGLNEETFAWLKEQASLPKTVAIGEIGLDYYWDKEPEVQNAQRYWFRRQMELARETNLPVIIHSRDAAADTMEVMKAVHAEEIPGVIHCYSYSREMAQEFIKMGYYIGVGGVVTFKNAKKLKETVEAIPLERILLETDCPYMTPEPHRGTRNDSSNIPFVIAKIAELKGITAEEVERVTEENAVRLFTKVS